MPPKEASNSRRQLNLPEKLELITFYNTTKCSIRKLAKQFCIGKTQAGDIIKKQDRLLALWNSNSDVNTSLRPNSIGFHIDKYVYDWYAEMKTEKIPISGPMIQNKALEIAKELGNEDFKASNGWLARFQIRHKIRPKTAKKRAKEDKSNLEEWSKHLDSILSNYSAENIFSAVETGLYFQAVPDDTHSLITETCSCGKFSAQRFTILFCISMTGSKEKPLVISKVSKSKSDEVSDLNKFQVDCEFNCMAWMTRNVMSKWLTDMDEKMVRQGRNVVLFLTDTFSHYDPQLMNIKIVYFPSCLSSENQSVNQSVIQNFKIIYRQLLLRHLINLKEDDENDPTLPPTIDIPQAVAWVETAWKVLSESVIFRCFEEIGFKYSIKNECFENEVSLDDVSNLLCAYDSDINATDYVSIDTELVTEGDDPEFIEVLMDGNEMSDIFMGEEEDKIYRYSSMKKQKSILH